MSSPIRLTAAGRRAKFLTYCWLALMILGSVGLDQLTKVHAQNNLMIWQDDQDISQYQGRRFPLWSAGSPFPGDGDVYLALSTNYVRNLGAAWGALSELPDSVRVPFFYGVTCLAVIVIALYMRSTPPHHRTAIFALSLILSGAVGNFIDRIRLGFVIDWIDVRWNIFGWRYDFPNFNFADSAITVGVILLLFDMLVLEAVRRRKTFHAAKTA